jgi:hypothetical protein
MAASVHSSLNGKDIFWMGANAVRKAHCVHTSLDEYLKTFKEGGETPTVLSVLRTVARF